MYLTEIPGYSGAIRRADRLEDYWRDYAFLGLPEELRMPGGRTVAVRQLTLRMFVQLCAVRSPFLVGGHVRAEHVAQILWRLSPVYDSRETDPDARKMFVAAIADLPFNATVRAISRYMDRMLSDKPPTSSKKNTSHRADTSFAASMVHALGKTYGWNDDVILDLPMPRLFQYLRKIHRDQNPELLSFNPLRDRFTGRITDKFLAERRKVKAATNGDQGKPI